MGEEKYLGKKGYQWYKHYARFMNRHLMYRVEYIGKENLPALLSILAQIILWPLWLVSLYSNIFHYNIQRLQLAAWPLSEFVLREWKWMKATWRNVRLLKVESEK